MKASDATIQARRKAVAQRVIDDFGAALPNRNLLCFFDDCDCLNLKEEIGVANRGLYAPVRNGDPLWRSLPGEARQCVLFGDQAIGSILPPEIPAFDHFVYLHGSTCSNDLGLTMTFAHELQHFVQHVNAPGLWAANTAALQTLIHALNEAEIKALGLRCCDIPIEREARIIAKRTAERVFDTESVRQYIGARIDEFVTEQDAADWKCIQDLDASARYDLDAETRRFFPKLRNYRSQMESVLQRLSRSDPVFKDVMLDELCRGSTA